VPVQQTFHAEVENGEYLSDKIKDAIAMIVSLGSRSAYRIPSRGKKRSR
jgi:hypothetical protein